ncbi:MAG: malectin domain-containing carbohydrate-binding protein, partial [Armatimonadota bacterium]
PPPGHPDHYLIDYVEGPNEGDSCPTWESVGAAQWFNQFWLVLAQRIADWGYKPLIGSIAVGNPPTPSEDPAYINAFIPALRKAKQLGGGWSYHNYTYFYGKDPNGIERSYSLRYRQFYEYFAVNYPDLSDLPIIFTEGGAEGGGGGWKIHGDQATFTDWLEWLDQQMQQDPYVIGCTLFVIGDPVGWWSYDVEDVAPWIAAHLQGNVIVPSVATEVSGTAGPNRVVLQWKGGYGSTHYYVKKATTSGGPYTSIGPVGSATSPSYTDTSVSNGTPYYYRITCANSAGESAVSNEICVVPFNGYRVNSGGPMIGSFGGDTFYSGGHVWWTSESINTNGVANAAPADVYKYERAGDSSNPNFAYTFPNLTPGTSYTVRLHFAEIYFGSAGARRFDVKINNSTVLSGFDIFSESGGKNRALVKEFNVSADASGQIKIDFIRGASDYPKCSGIEIIGSSPPANIAEDFENLPTWSSSFDNGSSANFTCVSGGQSGNCLQASRGSGISSARVKVYSITPNTEYTISVYMKCPSHDKIYWMETGYRLGTYTAQDFDQNPGAWTLIQKFDKDDGTSWPNGNGNSWIQYSKTFNSGSNSSISVGFKLGSYPSDGPTVAWDTLRITGPGGTPPPTVPIIGISPNSLSPSCVIGANAPSQAFSVENTGSGILNYSISDNATWLSVSPNSGSSSGEQDVITVNYSTSGLGVGTYNATITVSDSNAANNPQTISVELKVNPPVPAVPTNLVATAGNQQVTLSWTGSQYASGYNIKRSTTNGGPYNTIRTGVTGTSFTDTGLTNGTTYYYVVSAVNETGESANSNQASATPTGSGIFENFEIMPSWSSSYDASWGSAATWSIVSGGQSGNFLQAARSSQGSSAKVLVYTVPSNTTITISVYMKCPSFGGTYWMESAYKLGNYSAQDFDQNGGSWTLIQKFSNSGYPNGNNNTWTQYTATLNTGSNTQISIGYKLGSSGGAGPTVGWDTFKIQY